MKKGHLLLIAIGRCAREDVPMPRTTGTTEAGLICNVLGRGNGRMRLFHKPLHYAAFARFLF